MKYSTERHRWKIRFRVFWPGFAGGYPSHLGVLDTFARNQDDLERELAASFVQNSASTLVIDHVSTSGFEPSGVDIVVTLSDSAGDGDFGDLSPIMADQARRFAPIVLAFFKTRMPGAPKGANAYEILSAEYWPEKGWPKQVDVSEYSMGDTNAASPGYESAAAQGGHDIPNMPPQIATLSDDDVRGLLNALANKHVRLAELAARELAIREEVEQLAAANRLIRSIYGYPERITLNQELGKVIESVPAESLVENLREVGVVDALDDAPKRLYANLRSSVMPIEELALFRHAGISEPNAEFTLLFHAAQDFALSNRKPSSLLDEASELLHAQAEQMKVQQVVPPAAKRRKLFNGIGNIAAGLLTAGGNVLALAGTIAAPNPATAYLAIGSASAGIGFLFKGVGDLRGE